MLSQAKLIRKYGGNAPRYTSYPTAPHFNEAISEDSYRAWLGEIQAGDGASLYVHVPYCRQLCWYCGCNTRATQSYSPIAEYVKFLKEEISLTGKAFGGKPIAQRVHWGGGTPTILSGHDMLKIMQQLREGFDFSKNAEIAIEIDPRTLTESKTVLLAESGITRASLGVQEFSSRVQDAINRRQSYALVAKTVGMLRKVCIQAISFDLMYGLPLQTVADVTNSASLAVELRPNRIAVFGYAHVPWMKAHQQLIDDAELPSETERLNQAAAAARVFEDAGYIRIGLDHFALPDDPLAIQSQSGELRRNFQGYTDDQSDILIGFGASAIGSLPQGYVQNHSDIREYFASIDKRTLPIARGIEINDQDLLRRDLIERLMCDFSTDIKAVCDRHDTPLSVLEEEYSKLENFARDGVITIENDVVTIPTEYRQYVRSVCAVFDSYLKAGKARHSKVV